MEFDGKKRRRVRLKEVSSFQFGIEEEYFLCDENTLQPAMNTPESLFEYRDSRTGASLNREMLQAQLEVATQPHLTCRNAHDELLELRQLAAAAAAEHGLKILACGTHPSADWAKAVHSPK